MAKCSLKTPFLKFNEESSLYRDHKEKKTKCCRFKIEIHSVS